MIQNSGTDIMDALFSHPAVWLLPIAMPLAVALASLGSRSWRLAERLAPWTALPALLLAIAPQSTRWVDVPWLVLGSRLGLDETSRGFLFFTALLWLVSGMFAIGYLERDARRRLFTFFFLLAMGGNLGLILAGDMALFYVCFALMSFASYGLVVHNRDEDAIRAGRVYIVLVVVGELLLFSGLVVAASTTGTTAWPGLGDRLAIAPGRDAAMALLLFGLGVKVGALPLHVWLPLAHPAAPVPASAVLSGAMIKAGLIGWLRLVPTAADSAMTGWGELCLVLGVAAACYGVVVGLTQANPKVLLAYSSVSQMGLITVGVGLAFCSSDGSRQALAPVLAYAMHHAMAKGALFLGVGVAAMTRGAAWRRLLCGLGLLLPALALSGSPLTSGALAKLMLKGEVSAAPGAWPAALAWLLPFGAVGTTLLMARFLWLTWPKAGVERGAPPTRVWLSWAVVLAATALGVFLWPWGVGGLAAGLVSPAKFLAALGPVAVGATIAAAVGIACARGVRLPAVTIPAGDVLVPVVSLAAALGRVYSAAVAILIAQTPRPPRGASAGSQLAVLSRAAEAHLRRGPVFGAILLTLVGLLLGLFALW